MVTKQKLLSKLSTIIAALIMLIACFTFVGCKKESKQMEIVSNFNGGNVQVVSVEGDDVKLKVDLRDTEDDWFYWCFKVNNAQGRTLNFEFVDSADRVGYYGPAVSYDLENWRWQKDTNGNNGAKFSYTFSEDEASVYFAHDMVYMPNRFVKFAQENNLEIKEFCKSDKGNSVPYVEFGAGNKTILLTSRHHACESTGTYVLEGVVSEALSSTLLNDYKFVVVPFVDYDGVLAGDQGKNRVPHDHNRDYDTEKEPIYNVVAKIRELADTQNVVMAFDFHSPWHLGAENDTVFFPYKSTDQDMLARIRAFSSLLEFETNSSELSLPHRQADDIEPLELSWNTPNATTCAKWFENKGAILANSLEIPYFEMSEFSILGTKYVAFSMDGAVELGKCFTRAIERFVAQ